MPNGAGADEHGGADESSLARFAAAAMRSTPTITAIAGGARAPAYSQVLLQWPAAMGDGAHESHDAHAGAHELQLSRRTQRDRSDAAATRLATNGGHVPSTQLASAQAQHAQRPCTGACVPDGANESGAPLSTSRVWRFADTTLRLASPAAAARYAERGANEVGRRATCRQRSGGGCCSHSRGGAGAAGEAQPAAQHTYSRATISRPCSSTCTRTRTCTQIRRRG